MKLWLLLIALSFKGIVMAQDSWKVKLNGKEVLISSVENEDKNSIALSSADLKKKKNFNVTYLEKNKAKDWERFIVAVGENDELIKKKGNTFIISNAALQHLFNKSGSIKFYTWALPLDPKKRAAVRVRRVHLCTLVLK